MLVTYTVTKPEEIEGKYGYSVQIKTTNDFAVDEADKFHIQELTYKCSILDPLDIFFCLPGGCEIRDFEPEKKPDVECEDHYVESFDVIETVYEVTKNADNVKAFLECVESKTEVIELSSSKMCYYIGFKKANI